MNISEIISKYLDSKGALSTNSIDAYKADCLSIATYFQNKNWTDLKPIELRGFISSIEQKGLAPATIERRRITLCGLSKFAAKNLGCTDIAENLRPIKIKKNPPKSVSKEKMAEMIAKANYGTLGFRNYTLVKTLFYTGIRRSEICSLTPSQLNVGEFSFFESVKTKGNKFRDIFVPDTLVTDIEKLIEENKKRYGHSNRIFLNKLGKPLTGHDIGQLFKVVSRKAYTKCTPHQARHTFAYLQYEAHGDLQTVAELMGHESISTTTKYTRRHKGEFFRLCTRALSTFSNAA